MPLTTIIGNGHRGRTRRFTKIPIFRRMLPRATDKDDPGNEPTKKKSGQADHQDQVRSDQSRDFGALRQINLQCGEKTHGRAPSLTAGIIVVSSSTPAVIFRRCMRYLSAW